MKKEFHRWMVNRKWQRLPDAMKLRYRHYNPASNRVTLLYPEVSGEYLGPARLGIIPTAEIGDQVIAYQWALAVKQGPEISCLETICEPE